MYKSFLYEYKYKTYIVVKQSANISKKEGTNQTTDTVRLQEISQMISWVGLVRLNSHMSNASFKFRADRNTKTTMIQPTNQPTKQRKRKKKKPFSIYFVSYGPKNFSI